MCRSTSSSVTTRLPRNIAFGIPDEDIDRAAVERAAQAASLHEFISRLPERYETIVQQRGVRLSGGERQRIGVARALSRGPDILVMDEATSALDTVTEEAVMAATRNLQSTGPLSKCLIRSLSLSLKIKQSFGVS